MDNFGEQQCRLCLCTISDEHFKEINDDTKSIFDFLLLKLNLDNSIKYIMCNVCSMRIMKAFRFKSMCFYTYNTIIPYVDETECSIDLKEIYIKETGQKDLIPTLGDYKVCRFCMQLVKNKFIPAHEIAVDMIEMYISEINLTAIEDPVICKQCFDSFVSHSSFIMNCLEVNKKIKSDTKVVYDSIWIPTVDSNIKTEEMDIKSENEQEDEWLETDSTVANFVYVGVVNKTNRSNIKTECEDEKCEAVHITDSVLADSVNQYYPSQNKEYSATGHHNTLSRHLITHKDGCNVCAFQCDACDSSCKQNYSLKRDLLGHKYISGTQGFHKSQYDKSLKEHQQVHKDQYKVFECDTCDYKTKTKKNFQRHQLKHKDISETEAFECDTCDYKSKQKHNLKAHQLTHKDISETKVFQCDTCDYKTKVKSYLNQHQLIHKDTCETEVFECDTCDYKSKRKHNFKIHQLKHKDISETKVFQCDICDYKTKVKCYLNQHQLIHKDISETEVFVCDACGYKTKYKKNLKRHKLLHKDISETEVFECDACG